MERSEAYKALEEDFISTFIRELMPGVLHNFANPLNGIMGRSKLLQRRIEDVVRKIGEKFPDTHAVLDEELQRIKNDIRAINKESDRFFEMFRDASGKFYALASKGEERVNLSQLLAAEMRFANFYLEFKHDIRKESKLDEETPEIQGDMAELTLAFWRLIRFAMSRALADQNKDFFLETSHDHENIYVIIQYSGDPLSAEEKDVLQRCLAQETRFLNDMTIEKGLFMAMSVLRKHATRLQFRCENGKNVICLTIPYRIPKT
jgi:nitrogen-specific signal transduction histidine kinase